LVLAVILFSAAASASWYLQMKQGTEGELGKSGDEKPAKVAAEKVKGGAGETSSNRPLIRPGAIGDPERVAQVAASLQQQQDSIKNREQQVIVREKQMDLIHAEIVKEQKKLEGIKKEIQTELALVQEKMDLLEKKSAEVEKKRNQLSVQTQELDNMRTEVNGLEANNVRKLATIYDKMDPEAAAQGIEQMIEKGKLDMAVLILCNMSQRQAAGLLSEVSKADPGVAVQLMDRMRYYKTAQVAPK
jgi:flagellar motility protein MotE (MotC chaperone)